MMDLAKKPREKIKLSEINPHLTCNLCKGYYVDATTISECLHSFCRSCIIKFLHEHSYCPTCEVIINKAKPNLKLDKTLQDIVYKLVPELFLNEMKRRQRFYENHPNLAAKVTPEERGEDTERTIFNPRDTISLSIEYISDDSTPGAILLPQLKDKEVDNKASDEDTAAIKRFLQCPGMCRIEVLKKFIRNKYNVDTNLYYIDILYKRVPLPDHYTLIDIAYIYSWKRNEPMKFFFKITDIKLVTDSFDYLIQPQLKQQEVKIKKAQEKTIEKTDKEYTNITLDRSSNVEIITKIQKVSNKNGLQIGIKITKQTVKKPPLKPSEPEPVPEVQDVDQEKSQFLKSFQLTAKNALPPPIPKKKEPACQAPKRKNSSPVKSDKAKKPKVQPKTLPNPTVQQMVTNVNQNSPNLSKMVEGGNDLQALLFDSYQINIPSSLSVTVKNEKEEPGVNFQKPVQNYIEILKIPEGVKKEEEAPPTPPPKVATPPVPPPPPPTPPTTPTNLVKLNPRTPQTFQKMFEEAIRKPEFNNKFQTVPIVKEPPTKPADNKRNILEIATKLYKKTKMEQEKKQKTKKKTQERPLKDFNSYISSKVPPGTPPSPTATTKPVTVTSLHSPSLGLNYTVSVAQTTKPKVTQKLEIDIPSSPSSSAPATLSFSTKSPERPPKKSPVKKDQSPTGSKLNVNIVSSTENQPLSPNKLLEKYNIQNLAQLSANFNFPQNLLNSSSQLAAFQQAMIFRHFEMQNHQNWLNMNPGPLMQYEKYLKSFSKS